MPAEAEGLTQESSRPRPACRRPTREAMSLISANVDIPANPAVAADVLAGELEGFGDGEGLEEDG